MSLYKYFTSNCDSVCTAYGRPSERKVGIELDIKGEMLYMNDGRRYRVLGHSPFFFTCAYMYTDNSGFDVVRIHTKGSVRDIVLFWLIPEVIPVIGENGLPTDRYRMSLTVDYMGGTIEIPYNELADDYKPMFADYIKEFGSPVR